MRLKSVRIQNFRSFEEETVEFGDYTCLVGPNGSGKSNVLHALNVFFRDTQTPGLDRPVLNEEDFHHKNTEEPVQITVTFSDLSEDAQTDFEHYYRQGQLVVSAVAEFNSDTGTAEVKQYGQRMGIDAFRPFFEGLKEGKRVSELGATYEGIREEFPELPARGTKDQMTEALRACEEGQSEKCVSIPSEDQFYGVSRGANRLERYVQWVYVPAVKEASTEDREDRDTALGTLLARTVRAKLSFDEGIDQIRSDARNSYEELLKQSEDALTGISEALSARLVEWAHPDARLRLEWDQDREKAVQIAEPFAKTVAGENGFEGELTRFGHGLQRAYLLALLQELSGSDAKGGPALVLACEEPELYQHPPQARHLHNVLLELPRENAQVMVCTHSPYFVSGEQFESVRLVHKVDGRSRVRRATSEEVTEKLRQADAKPAPEPSGALAKIHQALQPGLSEMFFTPKVVFVEGLEDVAYITSYLGLLGLWDEYRRLGCHIIPVGRKSQMIQPVAIAQCLQIPAFAVFDADGHKPETNGSRGKHRKDNVSILNLCGMPNADPFPNAPIWDESCVMWDSEIEKVVEHEVGEDQWREFRAKADVEFGHTAGLRKNALHIARSLQLAWEAGKKSASLEKLCHKIIAFGEDHR